jgi:hypothetical protein
MLLEVDLVVNIEDFECPQSWGQKRTVPVSPIALELTNDVVRNSGCMIVDTPFARSSQRVAQRSWISMAY